MNLTAVTLVVVTLVRLVPCCDIIFNKTEIMVIFHYIVKNRNTNAIMLITHVCLFKLKQCLSVCQAISQTNNGLGWKLQTKRTSLYIQPVILIILFLSCVNILVVLRNFFFFLLFLLKFCCVFPFIDCV